MAQSGLIHCIYCGLEREPSDEHVLQRALGGTLTINCVCKKCNTGFSAIDQSLAEGSFFFLQRTVGTAPEAFKVYVGVDNVRISKDGHWEDVRVGNRLVPEILPQLRLERDEEGKPARASFAGGDPQEMREFVDLVDKRIAAGDLGHVHIKLERPVESKETRVVFHRHKDLYIRAASKEDVDEFVAVISRNWPNIRQGFNGSDLTPTKAPSGVVAVQVKVRLDDNHRAIAKIAYNALAYFKGVDFVMRDELTPLRQFIRGKEIVHDAERATDEPQYDKRFVALVDVSEQPPISTASHLVLLFYAFPKLYAWVTFYGQYTYLVTMADIELDDLIPEAIEFSSDRSSHHQLDMFEIHDRLAAALASRSQVQPPATFEGQDEGQPS